MVNEKEWGNRTNNDSEVGKEEIWDKNHILKNSMTMCIRKMAEEEQKKISLVPENLQKKQEGLSCPQSHPG